MVTMSHEDASMKIGDVMCLCKARERGWGGGGGGRHAFVQGRGSESMRLIAPICECLCVCFAVCCVGRDKELYNDKYALSNKRLSSG